MRLLKVTLVLLLLALQFKLWFGDTGIVQYRKTQKQIQDLLAVNDQIAEENFRVGFEIEALKEKQDAIEAKARNELGMVREGEQFFLYKDKANPKGSP